jgi:hypothetical protein
MDVEDNTCKFSTKSLRERNDFEDLDVDGKLLI